MPILPVISAVSRSEMPTALITGVAGFTGEYLTRDLLALGYRVVGLDQSAGSAVVFHIVSVLNNRNGRHIGRRTSYTCLILCLS